MKRRYSTILCLLVIVVSLTFALRTKDNMSNAQTQQTPVAFDLETLRESIGVFFENMSDPNKGGSKAVEDFLKNSSLADNEKIKTKFSDGLRTINQNFGSYVSYEPIGFKMIGADLDICTNVKTILSSGILPIIDPELKPRTFLRRRRGI